MTTHNLITICVWLLVGTTHLLGGTLNVRDYGAVGDDKTDNTVAFSKCLNAVGAAGGGRMFLPDGVYHGRLVIPTVAKPIPSWVTVENVGESEPAPVFGTIGTFPLHNKGTIVKGLAAKRHGGHLRCHNTKRSLWWLLCLLRGHPQPRCADL